jgi:hypothetical protein
MRSRRSYQSFPSKLNRLIYDSFIEIQVVEEFESHVIQTGGIFRYSVIFETEALLRSKEFSKMMDMLHFECFAKHY